MQTLLAAHVLPGLDLQPGARSLDIGSLSGQVPAALGRIGFRASGIEPMRSFAAFAKDRGLDVRQGLFPMAMPLGLTEERFDLVTCFEVIYYFHDLRGCMAALKNLLTPGGWLAIKCLQGDAAYFSRHSLFSRYKDNLQAAPTAKSLQRWLSASGFDVKRLTALPEDRLRNMWDLNLPGVLHKGQTLLNLALGCLCGPGRADRIMVIAQRRK